VYVVYTYETNVKGTVGHCDGKYLCLCDKVIINTDQLCDVIILDEWDS
jgi:hypothetical protein